MSLLQNALRETLPRVPDRLEELSALIDPAWIEQALASSGKASIRRRKLPAEHAVWLVIGLALFRDRPLWQVVQQLELCLDGQSLPAPSVTLIRMPISPQARKSRPELASHWQARLIEVSVGGQIRRFITSLQDHRTYPAGQLAQLYRQRWEIELGFREIKHSLQDGEPVLRSKRPELVRQELWGVLIAYTLLRRWMREIVNQRGATKELQSAARPECQRRLLNIQ